jgi:hypothetical protein
MVFSKKAHEGYVMVDHRASPGIPPGLAMSLGYKPETVAEGRFFEATTYGCPHCGSCYMKNPWRNRPREHCFKCNMDICDACHAVMQRPDYVHMLFRDLAEMSAATIVKNAVAIAMLRGARTMATNGAPPLLLRG